MMKFLSIRFWLTIVSVCVLSCLFGLALVAAQDVKPEILQTLERGDTTAAIKLLNNEIQSDPTFYVNYSVLGQILYKQGQFERAKEQLEMAVDKKRKDFPSMYYLGLTYIELGRIDDAEKLMDEGRKKAKDKEKAMFEDGYGMIQMAKKNYQEADKAFRQALVIDENNPTYHIHLGNANFRQGIPSLAISEYEKALQSDTASTEVYYNWAEACLEMKDYNCALEKLRVVLQKDSTHASAWNRAGGIYFKAALSTNNREDRANRFKDAIGSYKRYLELSGAKPDSSNVRPYFELAMSYLKLSGYEEAAKYFQDVLSIPYEPKDIYYNYGTALMGMKEFDRGAEMFKKHIEWAQSHEGTPVDPGEMYQSMGDAYFYMKPPDYAKAIDNYKKALEIDSTQKRPLQNIALAYHTSNNYREAMFYYQKRIALGIDSASSGIYKNAGSCALAIAGGAGEDMGAAGGSVSGQLASTEPTPIQFDPNTNWFQVAADYFARYLEYNPTDAKVVQMLGSTYLYQLKNCGEGVKTFERLLQLDPTDCTAKRSLGYAYFAGGEAGCPKNISKGLDFLLEAYQCSAKQGACKDVDLVLWIAQAYHIRGADRSQSDKAGSKADFGNAYDWYGKVLQCQPGHSLAKKGQADLIYEK